jgi:hypothetical protein
LVNSKEAHMTKAMHSSGTVAHRLQMERWRLLYLIERGDLPGPSYSVPGRRLFTDEDVARLVDVLERRPDLRQAGKAPDGDGSVPHDD